MLSSAVSLSTFYLLYPKLSDGLLVCDTSFRNGGGPAPDGNAQCNMACLGSASETCGGPNRLNVYQMSEWTLDGCYVDNGSARSLSYQALTTTAEAEAMTIESCISACGLLGYKYAGVEWSQQCCKSFAISSQCYL